MSNFPDRARFRRDHRWARGRMSDYLDGELAGSRRERMERHLGECDRCRRLRDGLRRTLDVLRRSSGYSGEIDAPRMAALVRARLSEPG